MASIALITGASRGIGAAIARSLSASGYLPIINYNNSAQAAQTLAAQLGGAAYQADVSDPEAVDAMFSWVEDRYDGVDLLVNNAGIAMAGLLTDQTPADIARILAVDAAGPIYCCRRAIPYMVQQKQGVILNISSIWGQCGASCEVAYSAAKAAVIGATKALAKELGPSGIRVNCIAPGVIDTQMNADLRPEDMEALRLETPLERIGTPEDVASMAAFLASPQARFITGQVFGVNGGFHI